MQSLGELGMSPYPQLMQLSWQWQSGTGGDPGAEKHCGAPAGPMHAPVPLPKNDVMCNPVLHDVQLDGHVGFCS